MTAPKVVDTTSPVLLTSGVARILRMDAPTAVRWLLAHGVRPIPDTGRVRRWSRALVLATIDRESVAS